MIDRPWVIVIDGTVTEGPYYDAHKAIAEAQATKRGGELVETTSALPWPSLDNVPGESPTHRYLIIGGVITVEAL